MLKLIRSHKHRKQYIPGCVPSCLLSSICILPVYVAVSWRYLYVSTQHHTLLLYYANVQLIRKKQHEEGLKAQLLICTMLSITSQYTWMEPKME